MESNLKTNIALAFRWSGRSVASLIALFLFLMFVGELLGGDKQTTVLVRGPRDFFAVALWIIYFISLLAGWKWEGISGIVSVAAIVILMVFTSSQSDWIFYVLCLPGILYSGSSLMEKSARDAEDKNIPLVN